MFGLAVHHVVGVSDALLPARNQMAISLGSHIILACFGMALPAILLIVSALAGALVVPSLALSFTLSQKEPTHAL